MERRITERDLELLAFIAEHRFVLAAHAHAFLRAVPRRRLRALHAAGLIVRQRPLEGASCYSATRAGMRAVNRTYRVRPVTFGSYHHDVGMAWLWLAATAGTFGPARNIVSERAMRSQDRSADRSAEQLAVSLGGGLQPHYPDLLLVDHHGRRIAFELELSGKGRSRREAILMAYAADRRIDAVLYLVQNRALGRTIQDSARRIGISTMVHVQMVTEIAVATRAPRVATRPHGRVAEEATRFTRPAAPAGHAIRETEASR